MNQTTSAKRCIIPALGSMRGIRKMAMHWPNCVNLPVTPGMTWLAKAGIYHISFSGVIRGETRCCMPSAKDLSMTCSLHGFPSFPENAAGYGAFCYCFSAKVSAYIQTRNRIPV